MNLRTIAAGTALSVAISANADVLLLASQGTSFYRVLYQGSNATVQEYSLGVELVGMTRVPVGASIFGGQGGAIIAVQSGAANQTVFRVVGAQTGAPVLARIGTLREGTSSPVFAGRRLFGGYGRNGNVRLREYNPANGETINEWSTGVTGGVGGLAYNAAEDALFFVGDNNFWKVPMNALGQPATQIGGAFPFELNNRGLDAFGPPSRPTLFLAAQTQAGNPGTFFLSRVDWETGEIESPFIIELDRRGNGAAVSAAAIPCGADFNEDEFIDFFDYLDYVSCFEGVCPPGKDADTSEDGFVDFFDYVAFVTAFESGC
ncbi:MAG: hypothetical protein HEQ23_09515 [Tepidisphaera sp.]